MSDLLLQDLKQQITATQVVVIVGTGVSMSTANNHPCASWEGLLHNGVDRCKQLVHGLPDGWDRRAHRKLIQATWASYFLLQKRFRIGWAPPAGGEYARWASTLAGCAKVWERSEPKTAKLKTGGLK